jgi:hypothetical protein
MSDVYIMNCLTNGRCPWCDSTEKSKHLILQIKQEVNAVSYIVNLLQCPECKMVYATEA